MKSQIQSSSTQKFYEVSLAALAWFSVLFQLYLTSESIFNFISYFTILSNLLVAIGLTCTSIFRSNQLGSFFSLVTVQSAIALYIFIVGLVYNLILRGIWEPKGWQLIVDNLLHVIVPLLYTLYWFLFIPKGKLHWKNGITWTVFPFLYLIYTLIRGHFTHWYPYPFMDVTQLGYAKVALNVSFMIIAFFLVGLLLITINRSLAKKITK